MGQTLSEPIVEKHSSHDCDLKHIYGSSSMQGWRITMEDCHCAHLSLKDESGANDETSALFGVFDGHGGAMVAKYCGQNLHSFVLQTEAFKKKDYAAALRDALLAIDIRLKENPADIKNEVSGSTAVISLVTQDNRIVVANVGDSRIVLSSNGEAIPLSVDHKPTVASEALRIRQAGGFVESGRVNGGLALSRAIGDFEYKKNPNLTADLQMVTAHCEIIERQLKAEDEFIVMACDGIWDCLTNQQVVNYVRHKISQNVPLEKICEGLMDICLAPSTGIGGGVGCDNMTVLIVGFLHNRDQAAWVEQCSKASPFFSVDNLPVDKEVPLPATTANTANPGGATTVA